METLKKYRHILNIVAIYHNVGEIARATSESGKLDFFSKSARRI